MRSPALFVLACLLLLVSPGAAQLALTGVGGGFGAPSGGGGLAFTPTGNPPIQNLGFGTDTATFSSVPIASGTVVVGVYNSQDTNVTTISSVTINGSAMTQAVATDSGDLCSMWYRNGVSGTTATIVVKSTISGLNNVGILVGVISGSAQTSPSATAINDLFNSADPQIIPNPGSLSVPTGGIAVIFAGIPLAGSSTQTATWTNTTNAAGDYLVFVASSTTIMLAHSIATGSQTYGVSGTPNFNFAGFSGVAMSWAP